MGADACRNQDTIKILSFLRLVQILRIFIDRIALVKQGDYRCGSVRPSVCLSLDALTRVSHQNKILELDLLLFTRVDHWPKKLKYKISDFSENSEFFF